MSLAATGKYGLTVGNPSIKSVGALAFGPDGILFVADNVSATISALDVGSGPPTKPRAVTVENLDTRLASFLGCSKEDLYIRDMAVRPDSEDIYLSVMRGTGTAALPVLAKVAADGKVSEVSLAGIAYSQVSLKDAPRTDDARTEPYVYRDNDREGQLIERPGLKFRISRDPLWTVTITDMAFVDGLLLVAGASNEEFSSTLRRIPFPFAGSSTNNTLEIFHVSHGRYETASPIRHFVPYAGNTSILASYTCTPVVHFPIKGFQPGAQIKGRTVAELGAASTPIDMVSFKRGQEEYLLVSNSRHPLMKIACKDIDAQSALTIPKEPLGVARQDLPQEGVGRMANLNGSYVLMMQHDSAGSVHLRSYSNATL